MCFCVLHIVISLSLTPSLTSNQIFRSEAPLQLNLSVCLSVCTPLAVLYMAIVYIVYKIFAPMDDGRPCYITVLYLFIATSASQFTFLN